MGQTEVSGGVLLWTLGLGLASCAAVLVLRYYTKRPKTATRVGQVSQLVIYPMKSGKGLSVVTAECLQMGFKYGDLKDRHWLVITEEGQQVTARQEPRLVLVSLTSEGGRLCLNAPDMQELRIPLHQPDNPVANCRVWGSDIQGRDCGEEAAVWLTRHLASDKTYRLVQFEPHMAPRKAAEKVPLFPKSERVVYPDAASVHLLSEASVKDLNSRLASEVTVNWFRPSIIVSGCDAFAEDSWDEIEIGNVKLRRVMACGRCVLTTVNPSTGTISHDEPLETLKSYRMCDPSQKHIYKSSPLFGQYYSVVKTGFLQVGDPIYKITY